MKYIFIFLVSFSAFAITQTETESLALKERIAAIEAKREEFCLQQSPSRQDACRQTFNDMIDELTVQAIKSVGGM